MPLSLLSSKLDHTICPDLFFVIEVWRYGSTSFSLLNDHSQLAIDTAIVRILQCNSKNARRSSGGYNFNLHGLKVAFCSLQYSRIIACHLHMNTAPKCHTYILFFHSQDHTKALDIESQIKTEKASSKHE